MEFVNMYGGKKMSSEKFRKSNPNIIQALLEKLSDFIACFIRLIRREDSGYGKFLLPAGSAEKLIGTAGADDRYSGPIKIRKCA